MLSDTLLAQVRKTAKRDRMTLEQLFISAIAEKLAALEADSLIKRRAAQADPEAVKRILEKCHTPVSCRATKWIEMVARVGRISVASSAFPCGG